MNYVNCQRPLTENSMAHKVIPVPTAETAPFWDAARAGILRLPQCTGCARHLYPPPPRCPDCPDAPLIWRELSGKAALSSWTRVHLDGPGGLRAPFTIVRGELEDASGTMIVATLGGAPDGLVVGQPIALRFVALDGAPFAIPEFMIAETSR